MGNTGNLISPTVMCYLSQKRHVKPYIVANESDFLLREEER